MTTSYTRTASESYSLTKAKYAVSKITADLKQLQRFYDKPTDIQIDDYREEAVVLASRGYISKVTYGFKRNGNWIYALEYSAEYGTLVADDRAGGVHRGADVAGAAFSSYLWRTQSWYDLSSSEKEAVGKLYGISRIGAPEPEYTGGAFTTDRTYSSQGTGFNRRTYCPS